VDAPVDGQALKRGPRELEVTANRARAADEEDKIRAGCPRITPAGLARSGLIRWCDDAGMVVVPVRRYKK